MFMNPGIILLQYSFCLPDELDAVNPFAPPPEFLAISPLKRIPVLRDTGLAMLLWAVVTGVTLAVH